MGRAVVRSSVVERTCVRDSQHFSAELRDFQVVVEANSHQMHDSVASAGTSSPGRPQPGGSRKPLLIYWSVPPGPSTHVALTP